jgi:hypothetical protein
LVGVIAVKLVQNTTDIPDDVIEGILSDLGGDGLSCAVRVRNCWNSPCFVGNFYPEMNGSIMNPGGKVYQLGGAKYGCKHVISMRVPQACIPMPARTSDGKRVWIEVPDRVTGLMLLAAHEIAHARLYEQGLDHKDQRACDDRKVEVARLLGLRMASRREDVETKGEPENVAGADIV